MFRYLSRVWPGTLFAREAIADFFARSPRPRRAPYPFPNFADRLEDRLVPTFGVTGLIAPHAAVGAPVAEVSAGTRLASLDTTQSTLLTGLLDGLTGTSSGLRLTAVDYNGLANADLNLGTLLGNLRATLGVATPEQALTANVTLGQLLAAAATAARADGDTLVAGAFDNAVTVLGPLPGTIRLGDLLRIDTQSIGSLAEAQVNALDLLTGAVELFNFKNVLTTTAPITVSGAALGLPGLLNNVSLQAQVVEPPVIVLGGVGTSFHSAQIRLKLDLDLVDLNLGSGQLGSLTGPVKDLLDSLGLGGLAGTSVTANLTLGKLDLFADVAAGTGVIDTINVLTDAVRLQATPSVADLYLGQIADSVFFDRTHAINPATDLTPGTVGSLTIGATVLGVPLTIPGLDNTLGVQVRAVARGQATGPTPVDFTGPYPQSKTIGSSAAVIGNMVAELLGSLQVSLTGNLGVLGPVLGSPTPLLQGVLGSNLQPVLGPVLGQVADPALAALGVRIGEMDLTVLGVGVSSPPVAADDAVATLQGRPVAADVLANDTIPPGPAPAFAIAARPAHGTVTVNPDESITYTPDPSFLGTDTFTYTLTDQFGRTSTATVTVFVGAAPVPTNHAPVVNPDVTATPAGQPVAVPVLANDTDPDGDPLTVIGVGQPAHGTAVLNADGSITYTPAAGFVGVDTFAYAAGDGRGGFGVATVTVRVGTTPAPDRAPVANPDVVTTPENAAVIVPVLANDTDPDGDPLTVVAVSQPADGIAVLNPDGSITFTPTAGFFGQSRFEYVISDGKGGTAAATVTVNVQRANRAPVINPDTATTPVGQPVTIPVLANDSDPDGDPLTIIAVTQPATGTLVVNPDGTITYTPPAGFQGTVVFGYTAGDGFGGTGSAQVTVTVGNGGANRNPVAGPDAASTPVNTPIAIPVLANDFDPDGDRLTVTGASAPAHGTVTVDVNGVVTYTPTSNYRGPDAFTYTISDGRGGTATGVVSISVGGGRVPESADHPPVVNGDSVFTQPGQPVTVPVLANDTDPDGDPLTIIAVTAPVHGTVTINPDGTVTYTPAAGFKGVDTFSYTASDGRGGSGSAGVQVTVGQNGPGPVLSDVKEYVVGADTTGGPRVTVYNPDGSVKFNFFAYDPSTRFGVNAALGDLDGDGVSDIITSPGFGGGPHIRVLSGVDLHPIADFFAFDPTFRGGVSIAVGDVNGDGVADLVVSAGKGGGPRVRVIDGTKIRQIQGNDPATVGAMIADFFAFDPGFGGGVSVGVVDRDHNGVGEVVTGSGPGGPPLVRIWDVNSMTKLSEFLAFDPSISAGVNVGGRGEFMVFGAGKGGPPEVRVYQGEDNKLITDLMAYEPTFTGGVRVNFGDTVDPTKQVLLIGAGAGGGPRIKVLRPDQSVIVPDYFAFEDTFRGGVYVA